MDVERCDEGAKSVIVIINPASGKAGLKERQEDISRALVDHGYTCQFIETSEEVDAAKVYQQAETGKTDLIAVSGGDGTVMQMISVLLNTGTPVAVVPAGTGNLLSHNLGIPLQALEAVNVAVKGTPCDIDVARCSDGRCFMIMGGMGLDGQLIYDADREFKNRWGVAAYFLAAIKNLARQRERVTIGLDDVPLIRRKVKAVLVVNMGKLNGGLEAIPTASPTDGLLDVVIIKGETFGYAARMIFNLITGARQSSSDVEIIQARKIHIAASSAQPVELDGEYIGMATELKIEVMPKAARILVPEDSPILLS